MNPLGRCPYWTARCSSDADGNMVLDVCVWRSDELHFARDFVMRTTATPMDAATLAAAVVAIVESAPQLFQDDPESMYEQVDALSF